MAGAGVVAVRHSRAVIHAEPVHSSGASHWQRLTSSFVHLGAGLAHVGVQVLPAVVHVRSPVVCARALFRRIRALRL